MSPSQRRVANRVLQNYKEVAFLTAKGLGKLAGVSEATVVRFAKGLGYEGFPEFRKDLKNLLMEYLTTVDRLARRASSGRDQRSVLHDVYAGDMENLRWTYQNVNLEDFGKAVEAMVKARVVYVIGLRSSYCLAFFLAFSLRFFLENVREVRPHICDLPEQMVSIKDRDVAIAISFPRYTRETVELAMKAKERGAFVIALTDSPLSPLARCADLSFFARCELTSFVESFVAALSLINALTTAVALAKNRAALKRMDALERSFAEFRTFYSDSADG